METPVNEVRDRLQRYCDAVWRPGEGLRIGDLRILTDGWENEVYAFSLKPAIAPSVERNVERSAIPGAERSRASSVERSSTVSPARQQMILRIYPGTDGLVKSEKEAHVMGLLHAAGFPVPEIIRREANEGPFGKPFVLMEKIDGRSLSDAFEEASAEDRGWLLTRFCEILVRLHAIDWRPWVPDSAAYGEGEPDFFIDRRLARLREKVDAAGPDGSELFRPVVGWLESRRTEVPCSQLRLIHGDYHPSNLLLTAAKTIFVIDWGNADIADLRYDLAWTLLLVSTYGYPEARDLVLREYERIAGEEVERIDYFEVLACARRISDIYVSLAVGSDRMGMRPEAVALMRASVAHLEAVYRMLQDRAGQAFPEVRDWISSLVLDQQTDGEGPHPPLTPPSPARGEGGESPPESSTTDSPLPLAGEGPGVRVTLRERGRG